MSTILFGSQPQANLEAITQAVGPAVTASPIELNVNMATTVVTDSGTTRQLSRQDVLFALIQFEEYITRMNWPFVAS